MKAVKLALLELRRFRGPMRRLVPVLLCLVPLLYGAMYLWANWDPYGKTDRMPVAVVNQDQPAHARQGNRVNAGDQLVQQLKASGTFDWHFVGADQARDGLEHGRYFFTIDIPSDFSRKLATGADTRPQQAGIRIELNDANNYIAGIMTEVVQNKLQDQVNSATHAAYVRSVYGELSDVRDKLSTAADGAHRLVGATRVAQQGTSTVASATSTLHDGADGVAAGAGQIAQAAGQIDDLSGRLDRAAADRLPGAVSALVTTARLTTDGLDAVHTATSATHKGTSRAVADLTELADSHPELRDDPVYRRALSHARDLDSTATDLDGRAAAAENNARRSLRDAERLQDNIGSLRRDVLALHTPLRLVDTGSHRAADGARSLSNGLGTLEKGSGALRSAADQAHDGAFDVSRTVDEGLHKTPRTSPDQVAHAAKVLGTPVHIDRGNLHPAGVYGRGLAPFFFGIALWVFGLFAYLLLRPLNTRALAGRVGAFTTAVAGWLPAAVLGAVGALVLYGVVDLALGLSPVHRVGTVALLVTAAAAFVAVDHCLRTVFGVPGDVLSLVLLILQLTASGGLYPLPTEPAFFQVLNPLLPMTYLVDGLRVTVSGGLTANLLRDFVVLFLFTAGFLALTALAVRRQRVWSVGRLHPDVSL
ncbi:YhgE/Pip family protein [Streptomyces sp. Je 1-4]|uniref:YhgE/Pip family protein n=1 Tax=Streptomyces TaxID=1883 RepID=UPI0021D7F7D8|nr:MULTISPECIES: YhgE/Pip family protein [unclassified Streptomyces]UYB44395.1 YhgE/Pip family protein [Streptomyces sp. Je 1-4]UZQ40850.1 YhgE/Pip family protein [Streptomyces sp. Je 1-4] [Streptomyces sp. Je 1-4 4N24]UZQ48267.1 YhgE/Pip family protein [Streptomyces sp. Je 1-4] [Streptomyces sp. Je 1-4 4N24_ara]